MTHRGGVEICGVNDQTRISEIQTQIKGIGKMKRQSNLYRKLVTQSQNFLTKPSLANHFWRTSLLVLIILGFIANIPTNAAMINLVDYGINIDGASSFPGLGDPIPSGVDTSGFDAVAGLGTISVTVNGMNDHFTGAFFDHEIDEVVNGFFNEVGQDVGTPASGQSWEIDEPGFGNGDIFSNFTNSGPTLGSKLDNTIGSSVLGPTIFPDDVAMALGWTFSLADDEMAILDFVVSSTIPTSFYLAHSDPESLETIYLSSTIDIRNTTSSNPIPEPSTILLVAMGIIGLGLFNSRNKSQA